MEGKDDREDDLLAQDKHSSSPREDKETSGRRADAKHSGGDGDDGDRLSDAELEQLFYAVDFLSGTLLEDLMPGDDPPDDVLEGGPLAAKCWEYTFSVLGEFEAASIDAGVDGPGGDGWSLRHTELHRGFVEVVEGFLQEALESAYGLSLPQFVEGCRKALAMEDLQEGREAVRALDGEGGAASEGSSDGWVPGIRRFAKSGTLELLDLISDVQRFTAWAEGMQKLAAEGRGGPGGARGAAAGEPGGDYGRK